MQDNDIDFSAKATGIDMSGAKGELHIHPEVNLGLSIAKDGADRPPFAYRIIAGIKSAVDPENFARQKAAGQLATTDGWIEAIKHVKQAFPYMDDKQAALFVGGYIKTSEQADNIFAVMEQAGSLIDEQAISKKELPPATRDEIIEGASKAYEEDIRTVWAKVLAGEMEKPGRFSNRTYSILKMMSQADALVFKKLCEYKILLGRKRNGIIQFVDTATILHTDSEQHTYNNGFIGVKEVSHLVSLGLLSATLGKYPTFSQESVWFFKTPGHLYQSKTDSKEAIKVPFLHATLEQPGEELSALLECGTASDIPDILRKKLSNHSIDLIEVA